MFLLADVIRHDIAGEDVLPHRRSNPVPIRICRIEIRIQRGDTFAPFCVYLSLSSPPDANAEEVTSNLEFWRGVTSCFASTGGPAGWAWA